MDEKDKSKAWEKMMKIAKDSDFIVYSYAGIVLLMRWKDDREKCNETHTN